MSLKPVDGAAFPPGQEHLQAILLVRLPTINTDTTVTDTGARHTLDSMITDSHAQDKRNPKRKIPPIKDIAAGAS